MILKAFEIGMLSVNNYLLIDENSKEAVLIDCSGDNPEIAKNLNDYDAKLKYILMTHGHFDHVLGLNQAKKDFPEALILVNKNDKELVEDINSYMQIIGADDVEIPHVDKYIDENEILKIGDNTIKIISTAGHTKGGVCYLVEDMLFSGDTIFKESVGRTDFSGGSFVELKSNIENKIFTLDDNIKIYPGHGPSSDVGYEKEHNHFL